jgi:hypothetical protein
MALDDWNDPANQLQSRSNREREQQKDELMHCKGGPALRKQYLPISPKTPFEFACSTKIAHPTRV